MNVKSEWNSVSIIQYLINMQNYFISIVKNKVIEVSCVLIATASFWSSDIGMSIASCDYDDEYNHSRQSNSKCIQTTRVQIF